MDNHNVHRLLAIFAHPDDETFRPGGTLALLARHGVAVRLLTATRGGAGSCGNPPLCSPEDLPAVRERELRCACAALGIQPPHLLDFPDGHLHEVEPEDLVYPILSAMRQFKPQVLLTFGQDGLSGHPDHVAIGKAVIEAFHRSEEVNVVYTMAVPYSLAQRLDMRQVHPVPDDAISLAVDVSSVWEAKLAALRCHATQWSSSPMRDAPEEHQRLFFAYEYFVQAAVRHPAEDFMPKVLGGFLR
jgi:LmbE family N-acetylglucosaminyl deacetylase